MVGYHAESSLSPIHKKLDLSGSNKKVFFPKAPARCEITVSTDIMMSNLLISFAV